MEEESLVRVILATGQTKRLQAVIIWESVSEAVKQIWEESVAFYGLTRQSAGVFMTAV